MALADNLVAFWKLGEASGARADSIGSNTLADNSTVTQAVGKIGNAAQFTRANVEFLDIADNTDMSAGDIDFTFGCWIYMDSKPVGVVDMIVASKWTSSGDQREWGLTWDENDDSFNFFVSPDGEAAGSVEVEASSFGTPSLATWIFILVWHDSVNNTINIQINDGPIDSKAHTAGVFDGTSSFKLGQINGAGHWDGRMDAIGWWKRVLTNLERTQLYNDGDGRESPFLVSTYTEPETVVTQACDSDTGFNKEMILPRFAGEEEDPNSITKFLDEQAEIIEDKYNSQVAREVPCEICVTSGAIVLDCGKCVHFEVAADADINSISFINCFPGDELNILFRASKDLEISGWPSFLTCTHCGTSGSPTHLSSGQIFSSGIGFPAAGGAKRTGGVAGCIASCIKKSVSDGASVDASISSCSESCQEGEDEASTTRGGTGPTEPTGTCGCTPDEGGLLTVAICTPLNCEDASPKLELTVCGGSGGYTWSVVGGETPTQTDSGEDDRNTKIEPTTNTTPGEPGTAYGRGHGETRADLCPDSLYNVGAPYNCAGVQTGGCASRPASEIGTMPVTCEVCCNSCSNQPQSCCTPIVLTPYCGTGCCDGSEECEQRTVDTRTDQMKTNGCKPCAATMEGMIVSVTDSDGTVVSTVVRT